MLDVERRDAAVFSKAAGVEMGRLELGAHRHLAVAAVMAIETGDVVRDGDAVTRSKFFGLACDLNFLKTS